MTTKAQPARSKSKAMSKPCWHLITGEYPPQPGGVSDYSAMLANAMARIGVPVVVWAPYARGDDQSFEVVRVNQLITRWSGSDLSSLDRDLSAYTAPRRLLVQYVPHTWGAHGLNLRFCWWLDRRQKLGDEIHLMVHEPFYPFRLCHGPKRWILAAGQRWMMRIALRASSRVWVAIPAWEQMLRIYDERGPRPMSWLPIPSTIPVYKDPPEAQALRKRLTPDGNHVIGTFGTYGELVRPLLSEILPTLLYRSAATALLLGRGGERFASEVIAQHPELRTRLMAPGALSHQELSLHLQACDLLLQPYPDGVSSRRTTVMTGLAHGLPVVTSQGPLSESLWKESSAVILVPVGSTSALVDATLCLLADSTERSRLAHAGKDLYDRYFDVHHTLSALRQFPAESSDPNAKTSG